MTSKAEKTFGLIVIIVSILIYAYWTYTDQKNKKSVTNDYELTIGVLTKYTSVGAMESFYMTYSYKVNYQKYERRTSAPYNQFPGCEHDFSLCSDKKFWVAYEKDNPSNSLVNVYVEIQDVENPTPPETLEGFR